MLPKLPGNLFFFERFFTQIAFGTPKMNSVFRRTRNTLGAAVATSYVTALALRRHKIDATSFARKLTCRFE